MFESACEAADYLMMVTHICLKLPEKRQSILKVVTHMILVY